MPVTTSGPDGTKIPREVDLLRAVWERCKRYHASDFTTTEPDIWQILMGGRRSAGVVSSSVTQCKQEWWWSTAVHWWARGADPADRQRQRGGGALWLLWFCLPSPQKSNIFTLDRLFLDLTHFLGFRIPYSPCHCLIIPSWHCSLVTLGLLGTLGMLGIRHYHSDLVLWCYGALVFASIVHVAFVYIAWRLLQA